MSQLRGRSFVHEGKGYTSKWTAFGGILHAEQLKLFCRHVATFGPLEARFDREPLAQ